MFSQACVKNSVHRSRHPLGRHPLGRHSPGQTPPGQTPPGRHPLGRHLLGRHPLGRHPPPMGRHPPPMGRHPPPMGRHPLQADTPPHSWQADTTPLPPSPPPSRWLLQWTVYILLECILVNCYCSCQSQEYQCTMMNFILYDI